MADRAPYKMRPVIPRPSIGCCGRLSRGVSGLVFLFLWALQAMTLKEILTKLPTVRRRK